MFSICYDEKKEECGMKKWLCWSVLCCLLLGLGGCRQDEFNIDITIPAGSTEMVCYADEEISPKKGSFLVSAGEGLGDTMVYLEPVEVQDENAYDEGVYLTPGMPVKIEAEKGGWFRIGVSVQNPTEEDRKVYLHLKGVDLRIVCYIGGTEENK